MRARLGCGGSRTRLRTVRALSCLVFGIGLTAEVTPQQPASSEPTALVELRSRGDAPERQIVRASMPWPKGRRREGDPITVRLEGADSGPLRADSAPILFWPDGSVRVEQLHFELEVPVGSSRVVCEPTASDDSVSAPGVAQGSGDWPFGGERIASLSFELLDPWERRFEARFGSTDWRVDETVSSDLVRVRRARTWCRRPGDADPESVDEVLFEVECWLVEAAGWPWAELTVALTNDPEDGDPVVGPARFRRFSMVSSDPDLRVQPRSPAQIDLARPSVTASGLRQDLCAESGSLYLGDRTRLAFRFGLVLADADPDAVKRARAMVERPALALPALDWVRATGAFGPLGGPAALLADERAADAALETLSEAMDNLDRGAFGAFGEPRDGIRHGRLRCGPVVLHQVLRSGSFELLRWSELSVLHHGLRPGPSEPRLPEAQALLRQGIPPFALENPHGYAPIDYEHLTASLVFDYHWLTGDPFARSECRRIASMIGELVEGTPFPTSRGEGRVLQTAALLSAFDPDRSLVQPFVERFIDRFGESCTGTRAILIPQPPLERALGEFDHFDATWQVAEVVRGLEAAARVTDPPTASELRRLALAVATGLAAEGFVDGHGPKSLISARDPSTFTLVGRDDPFASTRLMLVDAFVIGEQLAGSAEEAGRFAELAERLVTGVATSRLGLAEPRLRADRWLQSYFDRPVR